MAGGTTTITRRAEYYGAVLDKHEAKLESMIDYPLRFLRRVEQESWEAGEKVVIPLKFERHAVTTEFDTGWEKINLDVSPIVDTVEERWCDVVRPAAIAGHEQRVNGQGKQRKLDLIKERMEDTFLGLKAEHQEAAVIGNVSAWSNLIPLNGSDQTTGFLEAAAQGSQTNTIHGQSRATYTGALLFQNWFANVSSLFSANGLHDLQEMQVKTKKLRVEAMKNGTKVGKQCLYTSDAFLLNMKRATEVREQYVNTEGNPGRLVLMFGEWEVDLIDLPQAGTNTTANPFSAILVDHAAIRHQVKPGFFYKWSPVYNLAPHYDIEVKLLHVMCQQVGATTGTSGVLINGETW